ncbi:hypothetical protein J2P86_07535 [Staphylococcus sp. 30400_3112M30941]|nr:hypothetical protein [Staphylococcus sp. 30403_3112M30944]MBO0946295.1 hypothetical protein [Staphylococcus sp. 30402_3112M30943]MBO0964437.1 hypothetical protein [Staphylococcus sp. 30400_3112M30941]MBO0966790.1 hypothetical protein [Staphylococcus sp. 30401_3112M30942]
MHKSLLTQYLDKENVTSLDLHLINGEVIKVQEHMKDAESKTLYIIHPKDRVVSLDHVLYFDINVKGEKNNDSPYPS